MGGRRGLNGVFRVPRTGSPWRDLPERHGPSTTVSNRSTQWAKAGIGFRSLKSLRKNPPAACSSSTARSSVPTSSPRHRKGGGSHPWPLSWRIEQQDQREGDHGGLNGSARCRRGERPTRPRRRASGLPSRAGRRRGRPGLRRGCHPRSARRPPAAIAAASRPSATGRSNGRSIPPCIASAILSNGSSTSSSTSGRKIVTRHEKSARN